MNLPYDGGQTDEPELREEQEVGITKTIMHYIVVIAACLIGGKPHRIAGLF
jgi:hypothetical protein